MGKPREREREQKPMAEEPALRYSRGWRSEGTEDEWNAQALHKEQNTGKCSRSTPSSPVLHGVGFFFNFRKIWVRTLSPPFQNHPECNQALTLFVDSFDFTSRGLRDLRAFLQTFSPAFYQPNFLLGWMKLSPRTQCHFNLFLIFIVSIRYYFATTFLDRFRSIENHANHMRTSLNRCGVELPLIEVTDG